MMMMKGILALALAVAASATLPAAEEAVASGTSGRIAIDTEAYAETTAAIVLDTTSDALKVAYSDC